MNYKTYHEYTVGTSWIHKIYDYNITLAQNDIDSITFVDFFRAWFQISKKDFIDEYIPIYRYAYIKTFANLVWDVPKIGEQWNIMDGKIGPKDFVVVKETFFDPQTFQTQIFYSGAKSDDIGIQCMSLVEFLDEFNIKTDEE